LKDKLSQYDILRSLPFGGGVIEMDIRGQLLQNVLNAGWTNMGSGGFLQWDKISKNTEGNWLISGELLQLQKTYHVAVNDFLLTGLETGLDFLNKDNPDILTLYSPRKEDPTDLRNDIRMMIIDYIKKGGR
jgi:2',3'-cyclic-nucleotide 2'-phosphodiesterase (5'-nucleotidase family)